MKTLKGKVVSKGIAIGVTALYSNEAEAKIPRYSIHPDDAEKEILRLQAALNITNKIIEKSVALAKKLLDDKIAEIFSAHLMILQDPSLIDPIKNKIKNELVNAEYAIHSSFDELISRYKTQQNHFAELTQDFIEIKDKILNSFKNKKGGFSCAVGEMEKTIIAAPLLTLDMILDIPKERILGFIVNECGYTSHSAILARSMRIPVVSGINVNDELKCGGMAVLDANKAVVYVSPDKKTLSKYEKQKTKIKKTDFNEILYKKAQTDNKRKIKLKLNLNSLGLLPTIKIDKTDGVGLFRTEFLFLQSEYIPEVSELYDTYKKLADNSDGKETVIRLLDIDSEKTPHYLPVMETKNVDLGIRGARAVEYYSEAYENQMEAIFSVAKDYPNIKILYPMVSEYSDLMIYKKLYSKYQKKFAPKKKIKQGVLIEVPSAAIISDLILKSVDFVNIGSNDLLQYVMAASRTNPIAQERYHILHPAIVYLMRMVLYNARKQKKEVCLCGEVASITYFYPFLVNLGFESFSVSPFIFEKIRDKIETLNYTPIDLEKFYLLKTARDIEKFIKNV